MGIGKNQKTLMPREDGGEMKNDRFMWIKCAEYVKRHIVKHSLGNDALVQLVCRIIGNERGNLANFLLSCVGKRLASKYEEELAESGLSVSRQLDTSDRIPANAKVPKSILKTLSRGDREMMKNLFAQKAMMDRDDALRHDLLDADEDVSDYAEVLVRMIKKINSHSMRKLRRVMLGLVDMRIRSLNTLGSQILKKISKSWPRSSV